MNVQQAKLLSFIRYRYHYTLSYNTCTSSMGQVDLLNPLNLKKNTIDLIQINSYKIFFMI